MQIFLDCADFDTIKKYHQMGLIDGVTTNPSLLAKDKVDRNILIPKVAELGLVSVSVEMVAEKVEEMLKEAEGFTKYGESITIKLPLTLEGLKACKILTSGGTMVNVTLCFSLNQAMLAAKAGATFISPFVGRSEDNGLDGLGLVSDIVDCYNLHQMDTMVLAASLRNTAHIAEVLRAGADIITIPPQLLVKMAEHELTAQGQKQFLLDARGFE